MTAARVQLTVKKSKSNGGKAAIRIQLWVERRKARAICKQGARARRGDKELRSVPVDEGRKYTSGGQAEKRGEERREQGRSCTGHDG